LHRRRAELSSLGDNSFGDHRAQEAVRGMYLCPGQFAAVASCGALCACYVGVLYVGYDTSLSRDEPGVIVQRFRRVLAICVLAPLALWLHAAPSSDAAGACAREVDMPVSEWLGLRFGAACWLGSAAALGLTAILFLGPLAMMDADDWADLRRDRLSPRLTNARALLVGPFAEEWVFRAVMCPLLYSAGFAPGTCVLIAALVFGAAHLHHRLDMRRSWSAVLVMFTYTSLFGAYSAYLYMRTGHLLPAVLAHMFCNLMGLPDFGGIAHSSNPAQVRLCFFVGLVSFLAIARADAVWRPRLFDSAMWDEGL